jgi:hypothetical protein
MASIDICYAVAAYKSVAESEILYTRYKHSFVPGADSGPQMTICRIEHTRPYDHS